MTEKTNDNPKSDSRNHSMKAEPAPDLRVEAAAIRCRDGSVVTLPPPNRHHDIGCLMASQRKGRPRLSDYGFLLSDGTWCGRRKAMQVAIAAGQVSRTREKELTTVHLW